MNETTRNYKRKKADAAESGKESTVSAYSVSRPRNQLGCAVSSRPKVTRTKKKADRKESFEGFHSVGLLLIAPLGISRFAL